MRKISYENWRSSARKWIGIVKKTKRRTLFVNEEGFEDIVVLVSCGYCLEFRNRSSSCNCDECPLSPMHANLCHNDMYAFPESPFWKYCSLMQRDLPEQALPYAFKIRDFILRDYPDFNRAQEDGIDVDALLAETA